MGEELDTREAALGRRHQLARGTWLVALVAVAACTPGAADLDTAAAQLSLRAQSRLELDEQADLTPTAREILEQLALRRVVTAPVPRNIFGEIVLPPTIRVWRKSLGSSTSCSGQVDVIELERYVKGVLCHEWIPSWEVESLRAGAVAIRSYAASWVAKGGKYDCADLCDTTSSQVYKDDTLPKTDAAVDDTRGQVVIENGEIVFAEYSAENSDPTAFGVSDPPCAGKPLNGHGRGMCQWGSQRWAQQGKQYQWIAEHYYPGATLHGAQPEPDVGVPQPVDVGPPTPPDAGPVADVPPPLLSDAHLPDRDTGLGAGQDLVGGCAVGHTQRAPLGLLLLVPLALLRRRQ